LVLGWAWHPFKYDVRIGPPLDVPGQAESTAGRCIAVDCYMTAGVGIIGGVAQDMSGISTAAPAADGADARRVQLWAFAKPVGMSDLRICG
jgi:hypothetical protein